MDAIFYSDVLAFVRSMDLRLLFLLFTRLLSEYLFSIWALAADITSELSIRHSKQGTKSQTRWRNRFTQREWIVMINSWNLRNFDNFRISCVFFCLKFFVLSCAFFLSTLISSTAPLLFFFILSTPFPLNLSARLSNCVLIVLSYLWFITRQQIS